VLTDVWALVPLLRVGIPDPAIERHLRDELSKIHQDSANPPRSEILRALAEHGTIACLDDLEAMQYDLTPRLQTLKLTQHISGEPEHLDPIKDPETLLGVITRRADIEFGENIRSAIHRIRERAVPVVTGWGASPAPATPFALAQSHIEKAQQHATAEDCGAALNYCRKALEAALKSVIKRLNLKVDKSAPLDELQLPTLIGVVMQLNLPKDIRAKIVDVQKESTYGSHDQGVVPEQILTQSMAQAVIDKYSQIEAHLAEVLTEAHS
jgi:hypothetical protein